MNSLDLEVVNVLFFQQMIEAVEEEQWDEAAMALYKLYAIEEGERFSDLTVEPDALNDSLEAAAAWKLHKLSIQATKGAKLDFEQTVRPAD